MCSLPHVKSPSHSSCFYVPKHMCGGFWYQHPAHPRWEVTKGDTLVSLGSFSGCPKYSSPKSGLSYTVILLAAPCRSTLSPAQKQVRVPPPSVNKIHMLAYLWVLGSTTPSAHALTTAIRCPLFLPVSLTFPPLSFAHALPQPGMFFSLFWSLDLNPIYPKFQAPPWAFAYF